MPNRSSRTVDQTGGSRLTGSSDRIRRFFQRAHVRNVTAVATPRAVAGSAAPSESAIAQGRADAHRRPTVAAPPATIVPITNVHPLDAVHERLWPTSMKPPTNAATRNPSRSNIPCTDIGTATRRGPRCSRSCTCASRMPHTAPETSAWLATTGSSELIQVRKEFPATTATPSTNRASVRATAAACAAAPKNDDRPYRQRVVLQVAPVAELLSAAPHLKHCAALSFLAVPRVPWSGTPLRLEHQDSGGAHSYVVNVAVGEFEMVDEAPVA